MLAHLLRRLVRMMTLIQTLSRFIKQQSLSETICCTCQHSFLDLFHPIAKKPQFLSLFLHLSIRSFMAMSWPQMHTHNQRFLLVSWSCLTVLNAAKKIQNLFTILTQEKRHCQSILVWWFIVKHDKWVLVDKLFQLGLMCHTTEFWPYPPLLLMVWMNSI